MPSSDIAQAVFERLPLNDALELKESFSGDPEIQSCFNKRTCPLEFLGQTFKFPLTLLSTMFDTGCVLTGPRALEFFIPGGSEEKQWDFYVHGYKESVTDMIRVLGMCGVTWQMEGDKIVRDLWEHGKAEANAATLGSISSWVQDLEMESAVSALGLRLYKVIEAFQKESNTSLRNEYLIFLDDDQEIQMVLLDCKPTNSIAEYFQMMQGYIQVGEHQQEVRLFAGRFYPGVSGLIHFLNNFYDIRHQCFVGGWCASHFSYHDISSPRANPPALKRSTTQGMTSSPSLFFDFGYIFRKYLEQKNLALFDYWVRERRQSAHALRWCVLGMNLIMLIEDQQDLRRTTFAQAVPPSRARRLAQMIGFLHFDSGLIGSSYTSSVAKTFSGKAWFPDEIARSGSISGPLPVAGPLYGFM